MKKILLLMALFSSALFCMTSCVDNGAYEEGYSDGYESGYSDGWVDGKTEADLEWWDYGDEMYEQGKDDGFEKGYEYAIENCTDDDEIIWRLEEAASQFARENSGWSPEEAVCVIVAYQNSYAWYEDGTPPSNTDYLDAINCLAEFYYYFY